MICCSRIQVITIKWEADILSNKVILPINSPIVSTYPLDASYVAIAMGHPESLPWVYSNYIQLMCKQKEPKVFFFEFFASTLNRDTSFIRFQRVGKELVNVGWKDVVEFIKDCINMNSYIYTTVNKMFLKVSDQYEKRDFVHDLLIYGYDDVKEELHIAGNFKSGKYSFERCSYSEFRSAYNNVNPEVFYDWIPGIVLYKFATEELDSGIPTFEPTRVGKLLECYINSTNIYEYDFLVPEHTKQEFVFGLDVYRTVIKYIKQAIAENDENKQRTDIRTFPNLYEYKVDIRTFHLFYDHKNVMRHRLAFMIENNYIKSNEIDTTKYDSIYQRTLAHRNMVIKYHLTKDTKILQRLVDDIEQLVEDERIFLLELISCLSSTQHSV